MSLFDGSLQGMARTDRPAFCFQGHPEASPGPHDVAYLFDRFIELMEARKHEPPGRKALTFRSSLALRLVMPKRTDIHSILIIGAGPIVIGQACEFDYSGAQACKALREEGYKVILVNSNPATIMTDPEMADVTYIEPITWQVVENIIAKERPDALLPTMGGQTALNCALDLAKHGVLEKYGVEMIGATTEAIDKAEDREKFKKAMKPDRPRLPALRASPTAWKRRCRCRRRSAIPAIIRPSFTMGGTGGGIAYNQEEFVAICERGLDASPDQGTADRGIGDRLERIRDGGGARQEGQLHHHLLDRELRPDGRAHRRLDHRRAGADADRQGIPDHAQRLASRCCARSAWIPAAPTCSSPSIRTTARMVVIEMNPRVSRSSALASKATGFPIAKVAAKLAVGYTLDELQNDITGGATPASFEPTIDYVVTKIPRFAFEKFPQANSRLTTQMKSVGEVMAIGRTFQESLQKALRGLETGVDGLDEKTTDREVIETELGDPGPERIWYVADAFRCGIIVRGDPALNAHRSLVPGADRGPGAAGDGIDGHAPGQPGRATRCAPSSARAFPTAAWPRCSAASETRRCARAAMRSGVRPVYKRVDTCAAEFATNTAYMYSTYEEECEAAPTAAQENHGAGRRPQPHRPGHRVRLLLRACRARDARGRLRDHHGQLQPGDRFDRLRHLRPPVLRAADAGRRARDRGRGEALRRDRAVRRPDAAQAGARPGSQRRAHHRHQPGHDTARPARAPSSRPSGRSTTSRLCMPGA